MLAAGSRICWTSSVATARKVLSGVTVGGRDVRSCGVCDTSVSCGALLRCWLQLGAGKVGVSLLDCWWVSQELVAVPWESPLELEQGPLVVVV